MATTPANPLTDLVPARYRKYVYGVFALAALVFTVYQASAGDWSQFVAGLFAVLVPALAASNTDPQPELDEGNFLDGHNEQ